LRWKRKTNGISKLINYPDEQAEQLNEVVEETGFNFTEVQKMINDFFFNDDENLDEVFGEVEDDEEEDTEE
jgi:hypothetical protein